MKNKFISLTLLILSDLIVVFFSLMIAYFIRSQILPSFFAEFKEIPLGPFSLYLNQSYMALVWIIVFANEKLYTKRYMFWEEVKILLKSTTLSSALIMIAIFLTRKQIIFSRTIIILIWVSSILLFPLFRYLTKILLTKSNLWKKKLIILGVHQTSLSILTNIVRNKTMGYEVLGFLDNDPQKIGRKFSGVKVIGPISELENIIDVYRSKDIMITTPHMPRRELKELLSKCEALSESMWVIPRSGDFITEGADIEVMGDVLTIYIKKNLMKPWNRFIKTVFDRFLTLILIILLFPIYLVIAIAIKLESKGPFIFVQERLGHGKNMFNLWKFRSMYVNGDSKLDEYLSKNQNAKDDWEKYKKLKGYDPRVTKVGKLIRKLSLDELPQLFNVLFGTMSLVGPRPYLIKELEGKESFIDNITKVKPGISGLWQISGRSELPFEERLSLDEYYIRNWSLWLDISILLKSIKVLFSSKGAY